MTGAEHETLTILLREAREFRAEVKVDLTTIASRVRVLEDHHLTDTTAAKAAVATAATAAATAAAAATAVASAATAAAAARTQRSLSVRAWVAIGFAAASSTVLALLQVAQFLRGANL